MREEKVECIECLCIKPKPRLEAKTEDCGKSKLLESLLKSESAQVKNDLQYSIHNIIIMKTQELREKRPTRTI